MTTEDHTRILAELAAPFDLSEIKWRVNRVSKDKKRGAVIAYADARAYQDRLNKLFTPSGWSSSYHVCTLTNITHVKGPDREIMSGKVLSTCTVSIDGFGTHSGTGEEWADDENAMTSADAQAFKRACSNFGLGRYTYYFEEVWVELDEYKQPKRLPQLPKWALPGGGGKPVTTGPGSTNQQTEKQEGSVVLPAQLIERIEVYRRELGKSLYYDVINKVGKAKEARHIASRDAADAVLEWLEKGRKGIEKARAIGEKLSVGQYDHVFSQVAVDNLSSVPSMVVLAKLVTALVETSEKAA